MSRNASLFVWFRLLFNCRFYYPVYTILFLDFGLNLTQFAALNVAWALTVRGWSSNRPRWWMPCLPLSRSSSSRWAGCSGSLRPTAS